MALSKDVSKARLSHPLTDVQLGIWLGDQVSTSQNAFTIAHTVTIEGNIDISLLVQSIQQVLSSADTVRAQYLDETDGPENNSLETGYGQPVQILNADITLPTPEVLYVTNQTDSLAWIDAQIKQDVAAPLTLTSGKNLCRQVLYVVEGKETGLYAQKVIWYQRFHHIMLDGYSFNALTKQVSLYYQALLLNQKELAGQKELSGQQALVSPFTPFSDVVEEEQAYKASSRYQEDKVFWQDYVSTLGPAVSLSVNENRTSETQTLLRHDSLIPKAMLEQFVEQSQVKRVTQADVALALVFSYLHKMTGKTKIPVGFPFMGRMGSAALTTLGPVVNVLPLQVEITPNHTLDDVIQSVKTALKQTRKHQKYNAEQIARDVGKIGESFPFYAATVNLRLFDYDLSFADAQATIEHLAAGPVDDLDFGMHFDNGDLHLEWVANGSRYNTQELAQHGERFVDFAYRLAPKTTFKQTFISTTPVPSERELTQIARWQNSPYADADKPLADIVEQFFERSDAMSNQLAIRTPKNRLSHRELTEKALQWARALTAQGILAGDRVGLALPRDERIVIAMFALMRMRVTYVPMDPEYPAARLEWMLEDAKPATVLTTQALAASLPDHAPCTLVDDDDFMARVEQQSSAPWEEGQNLYSHPQSTAYIMYTSGSTGKPKGVSIPYQGIANLFYAHYVADYKPLLELRRQKNPNGQVRAIHTASFSFDSSWDMLLWLMLGQAVYVIDEDMRRDAYSLVEYIQKEELDTMDVPPSFLMQMLEAGLLEEGKHHPHSGWIGGEAASPALWEKVRQHPDFIMKNYYGPTENSVDSIGCAASDSEQVIIGRPICQTKAYLLDDYLQPVPVGVIGELYVAGPGLAHGYINRPGQTASRFVANPFSSGSSTDDERMYRTGDLARWLEDGQIEYIGRSDHQVQIRGFRVEPGEVESVLASLSNVTAALVIAEKVGNAYRLLAYCTVPSVTPETEAELTEQILAAAAEQLPDYMVPSALKVLAEFTLNVNGKVDRAALPKIEATRQTQGRVPNTPEEECVCAAMASCLGLETVYADDDFFHLGGDSITAMSLGNVLRKNGYRLRPRDVFSGKTAAHMAKALTRLDDEKANTAPVADSAGELKDLPILHWFEAQGGLNQHYLQAVFIRLPSQVSETIIHQALTALAKRHPVLAAHVAGDALVIPESFPENRAKERPWLLDAEIIGNESQPSLEQQADNAFAQLVESIDATAGPLMRATYLDTCLETGVEKGLVLAIHHLAVDGVSWRIILPELKALTEDLLAGIEPVLEAEETPLRQWQNTLKDQVAAYRQEKAFWKTQLAPQATPLFVQVDDAKHSDLRHERLLLGVEATQALLETLPKAYRSDVESSLLTVTTLALARHFNRSDLRYTLESHGRAELADQHGNISDLSRTVGWLTAEYPVRFALSKPLFEHVAKPFSQDNNLPYEKVVQTIRQTLTGVGEQGLGYGVLRYLDSESRHELAELEAHNHPEILFNYLGRFRDSQEEGENTWSPQTTQGVFQDSFAVSQSEQMSQHHAIELNIFVEEGRDGPRLALQWSWLPQVCSQQDISALTENIALYAECMRRYAEQNPVNAADTLVSNDLDSLDITSDSLPMLRGKYGALSEVLPVLPLQEGLLFHAQMEQGQRDDKHEDDAGYSTLARLTLTGRLDIKRLQHALSAVIGKYPQLGAIFDVTTLSQPVQVLPWRRDDQVLNLWPLDQIDLIGLSDAEQAEQLDIIERRELRRDFMALQSAGIPLLHATLVQLETEKYALFLNAHHLVVDGWSTPILLRDLLNAYGDEKVQLAPPSVPYPNVVKALFARDKAVMQEAWKASLMGVMPTMAFGENPPSNEVTTYQLTLAEEKFQRLSAVYKAQGVTLNSVLQTLWANVLFAMTGRSDVVFGTPISGRFNPVAGIDEHIGLFSNTVPVRVTLSPTRTLWEQIHAVQEEQVQLLEHDGLGLGEIQRLAGHSTLFDTLLVVENYPDQDNLQSRSFQGIKLSEVHNRGYTHYPLTVLALPTNTLDILFEYRGDEASIQVIMERFESLLDLLLADEKADNSPTQSRLNLLTKAEQQQITAVNQTDHDVPLSTLREQMWAQYERTPNAVCLLDEEHTLTYREAREQVVALAQQLQQAGVKPGDMVAVALPRSVRLTLALWAVIEVGAAYLPLDTGYPDDRLNYMLENAEPSALITLQSEASRFTADVTPIFFEQLLATEEGMLAQWQAPELSPGDAAYILYTSGSTGKPKGVLVSHQAIVNRILWMQDSYPMDEKDTVLQKTPCSFDVSVWEFFWSAMVGARLMMAPPESHRDPVAMRQLVDDYQVTTIHFVPSMLAAFVGTFADEAQQMGLDNRLCPSLRQVFCSGEALSAELSRAFEKAFSTPLHNLYGPTEAAVDVTYHPAFGEALARVEGVSVPIGKPVWNTQLRILDDYLRPTPIGVPGELYLTGVQLADGYWRRPDLSATRFVADPFYSCGKGGGERMYRTGDVVRWLSDGSVEYLGRSDDQLKIRGQRIELGEIERVLAEQEGVKQCAVVAKSWTQGTTQAPGSDSRQLVGYVVPESSDVLDPASLRNALAEDLPAHMVPVVIMVLDALPLSANGKLDRKALPLPSEQESSAGREPKPGLETKLAATFARILGMDQVYADDDFFALGGHSLLAVRLVAELRRQWQLNVSVGQVMVSPSVEKLAHILSDDQLANNRDLAGFGLVLPIRQGNGTPVFCIHPASGFAWQYTGFSRYLDANCPLIGLQSPRPDGPIAAQENIEGMIDQHLALLRQHQPQGPYRVMGYSLGGVIAHGIAVRLQEMGEQVSFLGLVDTYPPDDQDWSGPTEDEAKQEVEREKAQFMNDAEEQIESQMDDEKDTMFQDIVANYADSIRHLSVAKSKRFEGKATLFVADKTLPEGMDIDATWAPFVGELEQHHFDYPHEDIMSPDALLELGPLVNRLINGLEE